MYYYTYKITNIKTGQFYHGSHKTPDTNDGYFGSGIYLRRAIKVHGIKNFRKEIIEYFPTEELMRLKETELLLQHKFDKTYNLKYAACGGNTRICYNNKRKKKYIDKLISNPHSPIGKKGSNNHMFGKSRSKQWCSDRSVNQKAKMVELKADPKKWADWRSKVVPRSILQCKQMGILRRKQVKSTNTKTHETKLFSSIKDAAKHFSISHQLIGRAIKPGFKIKRCGHSNAILQYIRFTLV
jgi:group I intron endonuclease